MTFLKISLIPAKNIPSPFWNSAYDNIFSITYFSIMIYTGAISYVYLKWKNFIRIPEMKKLLAYRDSIIENLVFTMHDVWKHFYILFTIEIEQLVAERLILSISLFS